MNSIIDSVTIQIDQKSWLNYKIVGYIIVNPILFLVEWFQLKSLIYTGPDLTMIACKQTFTMHVCKRDILITQQKGGLSLQPIACKRPTNWLGFGITQRHQVYLKFNVEYLYWGLFSFGFSAFLPFVLDLKWTQKPPNIPSASRISGLRPWVCKLSIFSGIYSSAPDFCRLKIPPLRSYWT